MFSSYDTLKIWYLLPNFELPIVNILILSHHKHFYSCVLLESWDQLSDFNKKHFLCHFLHNISECVRVMSIWNNQTSFDNINQNEKIMRFDKNMQ